jgi:hypothetical protein
MSELLLDRAGRRRSPATLPGFHAGHAPGNKGLRYPADPPKVEEIIAVMRTAGDGTHGPPVTRTHSDHVASRAAHTGKRSLSPKAISINAVAHSWCAAARAAAAARWAWTHGDGTNSSSGLTYGVSSRSVRCSASSTAPRADATGHLPRHAPSCGAPPPRQEYGAASPRTSFGTPTPSRWHAKAYH